MFRPLCTAGHGVDRVEPGLHVRVWDADPLDADDVVLNTSDDFYEDDEPVEDVIAAFEAGEKGRTRPPEGWTGPVRVGIDLNVRVRGNQTVAGVEDADGLLSVGQHVRVHELETGLAGDGVVTEVDEVKRLAIIRVDWASLRPAEA